MKKLLPLILIFLIGCKEKKAEKEVIVSEDSLVKVHERVIEEYGKQGNKHVDCNFGLMTFNKKT